MTGRHAALLIAGLGASALACCSPPTCWIGAALMIGLLGATAVPPMTSATARHRWRIADVFVLSLGAILFASRQPAVPILAGVLAWLSLARAWTAARPPALQGLVLLAVLEGMLAGHLGGVSVTRPLFWAIALLAPAALGVIIQPSLRAGLLGAAAGAVGLAVTSTLPPEGAQPIEASTEAVETSIGFSRTIGLGDLGPLHMDPTVIATAAFEETALREVYLQGVILDRFTGEAWISTAPEQSTDLSERSRSDAMAAVMALEPLTGGVLLGPAPMVSVQGVPAWRDPWGTWRHTGPPRPVQYRAVSLTGSLPEPMVDSGRWLGLPASLDPRVRTLAAQLRADAPTDRRGAADYTAQWLRERYVYTRLPQPGTARQALSTFLFESRAGHCEYFATALAVLLRAQGIEARVISGLRAAAPVDQTTWVFLQQDAHAWVEVYLPGEGWVRMDATPAELRQPELLASGASPHVARPGFIGLCVLLCVIGGGGVWLLARPPATVRGCYRRGRALAVRRGWAIPPSLPPVAAGEWLTAQAGEVGTSLTALAWLLYRERYTDAGGDRDAARQALRRLNQLPRRR
ncbi:MAG: transglutaminase-like domain-containing protein [Myxococcota bacterium]